MDTNALLAERMRPTSLNNYIGQKHIVGERAILRNAIESNLLPSIILWGPPGAGKTTLANIISRQLKLPFYALGAINSGVKDIREVIEKSKDNNLFTQKNPILFIDEIHSFSKSQQDSLLGAVEKKVPLHLFVQPPKILLLKLFRHYYRVVSCIKFYFYFLSKPIDNRIIRNLAYK